MNQKKKRPAARRALSGLLALMLVVSLVQQYPVSAQESEQQITEQQGENNDSGSEQEEGVIVTGEEVKSPEGQNTDEGFENSGEEKNGQAEETSDQSGEQTSNPQTTDGPETGVEVQPGEDTQGGTVQTEDGQPEMISDDAEGKAAARISFRAVRAELEDVEVTLEINGTQQTITYPAGLITDNLASLNSYLEGKETFQKAVLRKQEADGSITETEIFRIGTYEGAVYYSLSEQQDTGILLNGGESIVIVCASQYQVTYSTGENGTITGPELIWDGNGLEATVTANKYYHIKNITWSDGNGTNTVEVTDEDNMQVSISAESIKNDITVAAEFEKDNPYMITKGQIQQGGICLNQGQEGDDYYPEDVDQPIPAVEPGNTQTFMVYSQSWTGGDEWYLNLMRINGENINVPLNYDVGASSETVLSNGSVVTIKLVQKNVGLYWKDGDPHYGPLGAFWWWDKERCLYEVSVSDVQEDLVIDLNFKKGNQREMILTGLEGIASFGASSERYDWEIHWDPDLNGYHYYYDVQPNDGDTVYTAYYNNTSGALANAYNIYLYSVKPGYNPNTIDFEVFYDGIQMDQSEALASLRDGSGNSAWMLPISEMVAGQTTNFRHFENFTENASAAGYTYCFALNQNSAYNQVLRLKANPYQYHLVFDLADGTYDETDLDTDKYSVNQDGTVTEKNEDGQLQIYTLANGSVSVNMPLTEPEKEGSIFKGWQLYADGDPVDSTLYSANQSFVIDENTIQYSEGNEELDENHTFTFVAQWEDVASSTETAAYFIEYYREDPNGTVEVEGKKYTQYYATSDYGTVGSSVVALNDRNPGSEYSLNQTLSNMKIDNLPDENDPDYSEKNKLVFYYDLKTFSLTVAKDVQEDGDLTRKYDIQITLKDADGNLVNGTYGEVTFVNGRATVSLKDGESKNMTGIPTGYKYSVKETEELPAGYTITYKTGEGETSESEPADVILSSNTIVTVINTRTVTPDSGLSLGMAAAGTGAGLSGLIGVLILFLYRRRRHA